MTPLTFHLIPHTHWDREWYLPHAAFQARLIPAIGELLDSLEQDDTAHFLLDGQTIIAEDVCDVRPEWRSRLRAAVARGQLEVGPWYILADEIVPSGESLVRNLLAGTRDAHAFGARMNVLYSPDAFGHPAVLPTLAAQFGITAGATWRGLGRPNGIDRDFYRWRGPDGSELLLYHFPSAGYEIGADLAGDLAGLPALWQVVREKLTGRAVTSHVAVFVGADHHAPPRAPSAMRDAIQALEAGNEVRLSSLGDFVACAAPEATVATTLTGELRWSYGHTWTLQGTHATRARLKRQHGAAELFLLRAAEPLAALAAFQGRADLTALVRRTWRTLLQCQFHDTLCGCCHDDVAHEQATRLRSVAAATSEITRTALAALSRHDPDRARAESAAVTPTLLLWNPTARSASGIVVAELTFFRRDTLVGPPNGRQPRVGDGAVAFALTDGGGRTFPVQLLSSERGSERLDAPRHYPDQDEVDRVRVAFDAPAIPGLGLLALVPAPSDAVAVHPQVTVRADRIANAWIALEIAKDGRIRLIDRRTEEQYHDILQFLDEVDEGDSYTPQTARATPAPRARVTRRSILAVGPLVGALEVGLSIPSRRGSVSARVVLVVHADSPIVRIQVTVDNRASDHRLRTLLPIGVGETACSGAAFGFEQRAALALGSTHYPAEQPLPTAPAQRFVAAGNGDRGLAVFAPAFFEYEWTPARELLISLLRSTGELSRDTLSARPGHAGWPVATPEAEEHGHHLIALAVAPVTAADRDDPSRLEDLWAAAFLPVQTTFLRHFTGNPDGLREVGAELDGPGLVVTAIKPAESGAGMVVRCFNSAAVAVNGCWTFPHPLGAAELVRADETVVTSLPIHDHRKVRFLAPAGGLVSVRVHPASDQVGAVARQA